MEIVLPLRFMAAFCCVFRLPRYFSGAPVGHRHSETFAEELSKIGEIMEVEYGVYFSILCAISRGKTTRNEIEQTVGRQVGGYLARLEDDYALIRKHQPLFARTAAKTARYRLNDNFLSPCRCPTCDQLGAGSLNLTRRSMVKKPQKYFFAVTP